MSVEGICELNYEKMKQIINSTWLIHKYDEPGCAARMVVVDGNEKIYRYICAKTVEKIKGS